MELPRRVATAIAITVTIVWAVLNLLDPLLDNYQVDPQLDVVMGAMLGAFGATAYVMSKRNGGNGGS